MSQLCMEFKEEQILILSSIEILWNKLNLMSLMFNINLFLFYTFTDTLYVSLTNFILLFVLFIIGEIKE